MSKRQPLGTTGKLALAAGKRSRARQLLDREQRKRDRRDLLSLAAGRRPGYRATIGVTVAFETGSQRTARGDFDGLPRPQQLDKPPPPKLPAVPLGGRWRRDGR